MKRILLKIEYVGTNFYGWQRQPHHRSVQEEVETAIEKLTGVKVFLHASGRTDGGVHALGQRAHFDTDSRVPAYQYELGLNHYLPEDVKIREAREVPETFHARFDARKKTYCYRMYVSRTTSPVLEPYTLHVIPPLDVDRMIRAARDLPGTHDFRSLHGHMKKDPSSTVRTIYDAHFERRGDELVFWITGNGFLYNMVRLIAGTLLWIGYGKLPEDYFQTVFASPTRCKVGKCLLGKGLFLVDVDYGEIPPPEPEKKQKNISKTPK